MEGSASHGEHAAQSTYPLRVEAELDSHVSRWLWLVKWVLVIPHVIALVFLWIAFVVLTVVAFFAILFTGRYPPFTLAEAPGYPATAVPRRRRVRRRRVGRRQCGQRPRGMDLRQRPDRPAGVHRRHRAAVHRSLPASDLRLRHGDEPLVLSRRRLRDPDDRRLPAVPVGHGRPGVGA